MLGAGAFGKVYKGLLDGKYFVALKEMNSDLLRNTEDWQLRVMCFLHEIKYSCLVSHQNFAKLYGVCLE